jgi:ABC-type nitrate/sulfonate/bicarbonate transport system substrate-binding protein
VPSHYAPFACPKGATFAVVAAMSAALVFSAPAFGAQKSKTSTKTTKTTKARATTSVATTAVPTVATTAKPSGPSGNAVTAEGISAQRCELNKKAGKITYLSGFDYAATAGIVEMIVADAKGYFKKMCLDVDVKASFSTANYALVADNKAQFASAGSYVELVKNTPKERPLTAVYELGKTAIESLLARDDGKTVRLADLQGKVIGMKGDIPPSIVAMLNKAGLKRGVDYRDQLVDGFNPVAHFSLPIDALPVYKSNEPGQLSRNTPPIKYVEFDPTDYEIPGSFGIVYTNAKFAKENPTATQDFVRAALKGYADAAANPDEAVAMAVKRINGNGNKNFLSPIGEGFRWKIESKVIAANTPAGQPIGIMNARRFEIQADVYTQAAVFASKPTIAGTFDDTIAKGIYDAAGNVIWPK